jgi:Flp pilus assembly protein TadG
MVVALIACAGLAVDGGRILAARRNASAIAAEAARRASQEIELVALTGGQPTLDPERAGPAARAVLARSGADGTVVVTADRVVVTARLRTALAVLGAFGVGPSAVSATRIATVAAGT